ncbi:hypothetical protein PLICRDRAFT_414672 [Plicaturopsis crispa FD-325 SS-3]|nr:hypothetical protein PLICRDRAFT_414672 [Plicaturopsis crispa FD-325 SS-3]
MKLKTLFPVAAILASTRNLPTLTDHSVGWCSRICGVPRSRGAAGPTRISITPDSRGVIDQPNPDSEDTSQGLAPRTLLASAHNSAPWCSPPCTTHPS